MHPLPRRALLAGGLALAGCTGSGPPAAPAVVRVAHESEPLSLDPAVRNESATFSVLSNFYEPLVTFDRDMRLQPALALRWSAMDERTWVLNLRVGVRFHDGSLLTAREVKADLERISSGRDMAFRSHLSTIEQIEVMDDTTLRVRTTRPDALFVSRLTLVLLSRPAPGVPGERVGTGPYRIERFVPGQPLEAVAFPDHWAGLPPIPRAQFVAVEAGEKVVEALKRHEVDVLRFVPGTLEANLRSDPGVRLLSRPGLLNYYLWMNAAPAGRRGPFADPRVRRAVALALDRKALVAAIGGQGEPAAQLVHPGVFGHVGSIPPLPFDPDGARRLLAEAGYPRGFAVELSHRGGPLVGPAAEEAARMLTAVGIRTTPRVRVWGELVDEWTAGRASFFLGGWLFENGDAYAFLVDCLMTRSAEQSTGSFNPGYSSPEIDRLIGEHAGIFSDAERLRHYAVLMPRLMEEMPIVPLYTRRNVFGVSPRVHWEPRLDGRLLVSEMSLP